MMYPCARPDATMHTAPPATAHERSLTRLVLSASTPTGRQATAPTSAVAVVSRPSCVLPIPKAFSSCPARARHYLCWRPGRPGQLRAGGPAATRRTSCALGDALYEMRKVGLYWLARVQTSFHTHRRVFKNSPLGIDVLMPISRTGSLSTDAEEVASVVPEEASRARSRPFFQRFARLGIFAAVTHLNSLLAYIAAVIGLTHSAGRRENSSGALSEVGRQLAGLLLLGLLAVGLVAYAVWRIAQALSGDQGLPNGRSAAAQNGRSSAAKDAINRVGWAFVGVVYFSLCGQADPVGCFLE